MILDPQYKDLLVTPGATTSSPGLAFLLATIANTHDWPAYWKALLANGAKITQGWSDAYEVDFTQGGGGGDRPVVVSYDSSPAFTLDDAGGTTTAALLDTCFRQVEYAGVLAGADNPDGAEALIDFLLTREVQESLPESIYVFPVDASLRRTLQPERFSDGVAPSLNFLLAPPSNESYFFWRGVWCSFGTFSKLAFTKSIRLYFWCLCRCLNVFICTSKTWQPDVFSDGNFIGHDCFGAVFGRTYSYSILK